MRPQRKPRIPAGYSVRRQDFPVAQDMYPEDAMSPGLSVEEVTDLEWAGRSSGSSYMPGAPVQTDALGKVGCAIVPLEGQYLDSFNGMAGFDLGYITLDQDFWYSKNSVWNPLLKRAKTGMSGLGAAKTKPRAPVVKKPIPAAKKAAPKPATPKRAPAKAAPSKVARVVLAKAKPAVASAKSEVGKARAKVIADQANDLVRRLMSSRIVDDVLLSKLRG